MVFLEWHESFNIGISEVDDEHKKLIEMLNNVYSLIKKNEPRDSVLKSITNLIDFTKYHFLNEEMWMVKNKYPEYSLHKAVHHKLLSDLEGYLRKINQENFLQKSEEIIVFIKSWWMTHVLDNDSNLGHFKRTGTIRST